MNWTRIIAFGLLTYVTVEIIHAAFEWSTRNDWRVFLPLVAVGLPVAFIMGWFAVIQPERKLLHVLLATLVAWLPGIALGVMAHPANSVGFWMLSLVPFVVASGIGLGVGISVKKMVGAR